MKASQESPKGQEQKEATNGHQICLSFYGQTPPGEFRGFPAGWVGQMGRPIMQDLMNWNRPKAITEPGPFPETSIPNDHLSFLRDYPSRNQLPVTAESAQLRGRILATTQQVFAKEGWELAAAHVRDKHIFLVYCGSETAATVVKVLKAAVGKRLREDFGNKKLKIWRPSSQQTWLLNPKEILYAIRDILYEQGERMTVYINPRYARHFKG